jgi:hypothetical protein
MRNTDYLLDKCKQCEHYEHYDKCWHIDVINPANGKPASARGVVEYGTCERNNMFTDKLIGRHRRTK